MSLCNLLCFLMIAHIWALFFLSGFVLPLPFRRSVWVPPWNVLHEQLESGRDYSPWGCDQPPQQMPYSQLRIVSIWPSLVKQFGVRKRVELLWWLENDRKLQSTPWLSIYIWTPISLPLMLDREYYRNHRFWQLEWATSRWHKLILGRRANLRFLQQVSL